VARKLLGPGLHELFNCFRFFSLVREEMDWKWKWKQRWRLVVTIAAAELKTSYTSIAQLWFWFSDLLNSEFSTTGIHFLAAEQFTTVYGAYT